MLYGRQAIRVERRGEAQLQIGYVISGYFAVLADFRLLQSSSRHTNIKLFGCYMVKPHGQLVLVSSTPHSAYTPNLSTS